jgi:hypothetical protein
MSEWILILFLSSGYKQSVAIDHIYLNSKKDCELILSNMKNNPPLDSGRVTGFCTEVSKNNKTEIKK